MATSPRYGETPEGKHQPCTLNDSGSEKGTCVASTAMGRMWGRRCSRNGSPGHSRWPGKVDLVWRRRSSCGDGRSAVVGRLLSVATWWVFR